MEMDASESPGRGGWTRWLRPRERSTLTERSWFEGIARMSAKEGSAASQERARGTGSAIARALSLRSQLRAGASLSREEAAQEARLAPFRVALARAKAEGSPEAWRLAMRACSQLALESSLPMRKAGQLVFTARIEPEMIGREAARALVLPIQKEAGLRPEAIEGLFGYEGVETTDKIERLWWRFEAVAMGLPKPGG